MMLLSRPLTKSVAAFSNFDSCGGRGPQSSDVISRRAVNGNAFIEQQLLLSLDGRLLQ